jgi:metal-sulfur cluster biosynthetic enzyme
MMNSETIHQAVIERLSQVIDPETGVDVIHMCLIEDLSVDENGRVTYTFRPSSPLCPIAVPLANTIQLAVAKVPGITSQDVRVVDFILSNELMELLRQALED